MNDSPIAVLADATTGALVTTMQDGSARRLQVESKSLRPVASGLINKSLLNGASSSLLVSGSTGTPIKFSFTPASTASIIGVTLVLTAGTINFAGSGRFLNGGAMVGGLQIGVTISGVTTVMATLRCNEDFLQFSGASSFNPGSAGGLLSGGTNSILTFSLGFSQMLASGDQIFISVQDNLTSANTGNNLIYAVASTFGYYTP